ncbi:hypothetical protein [Streptomyces specialis]|uniref:hypothetical protein n=1 Tax=Streptomyces specialis TaxID=498367 RepID=UPI00073E5F5F|nr:hypothetical protein [Streptomyces specialis]
MASNRTARVRTALAAVPLVPGAVGGASRARTTVPAVIAPRPCPATVAGASGASAIAGADGGCAGPSREPLVRVVTG